MSMSETKKIIIAHASVGSGHKTAAFAIQEALDLLRKEVTLDSKFETEVIDILDYGRVRVDGNRYASTFTGATRPIYDLTWRYTFTGRLLWGGGTGYSRVFFNAFTEKVKAEAPAAIVCTHITAANAAVGAKMITGQNFPIICVPTDYEVEGLWPHAYADLFCVANEEMAETLRARHIHESKIWITGIPTSPEFTETYDRNDVCEEFDLPKDKQLVMAIAGASLLQPYVHIKKIIQNIVPYCHEFENMHFVIVVGKDAELKHDLKQFAAEHNIQNLTVFGYVEQMAMLLSACDLVVCKAGGMTVTECLCAGTPMILTCRAYGQEKANVKMLTASGAAIHVTTTRELLSTLRLANANKDAFKGLKTAAEFLRRPNASLDIAKETLLLAESHAHALATGAPRRTFLKLYFGDEPAHTR